MPRRPAKIAIPAPVVRSTKKGKRRCANPDCNCILSEYNTGTRCFPCQAKQVRDGSVPK